MGKYLAPCHDLLTLVLTSLLRTKHYPILSLHSITNTSHVFCLFYVCLMQFMTALH